MLLFVPFHFYAAVLQLTGIRLFCENKYGSHNKLLLLKLLESASSSPV